MFLMLILICRQKYNEFVLCVKKEKGDESACSGARQLAHSICLDDWMEKWDGERKEGKFLGVQEHAREKSHGHH